MNTLSLYTDGDDFHFVHAISHRTIANAIALQYGISVMEYPLAENLEDLDLYAHQELHNEAARALGITSPDLKSYDLRDAESKALWLYANWADHVRLALALAL